MDGHVIDGLVDRYLAGRDPCARYSSFDYCFNFFRSAYANGQVDSLADPGRREVSCLQLGLYLASWGMYRGSTELLKRSGRTFVPVIEAVVAAPREIWDVDVDRYTPETIELVLQVRDDLRHALPGRPSHTLLSKTMLGVFGCVPAFDQFFRDGAKEHGLPARNFDARSLSAVAAFHADHADVIDRRRVATLDFETGEEGAYRYTRAKVVDMIFFSAGYAG